MGNCGWCEIPESEDYAEIPSGDPLKQVLGQEYKVLLLGSGSTGKTTFSKYIWDSYQRNTPDQQICTIRYNCIDQLYNLVQKTEQLFDIENNETTTQSINLLKTYFLRYCEHDDLNNNINELRSLSLESDHNDEHDLGLSMKHCWNLDPVQQVFMNRFDKDSQIHVMDNMEYYFEKIEHIMHENYIPTKEDIGKYYEATTGVRSFRYSGDRSCRLMMYDVGGRRSERNKWIHMFNLVHCIVYFCALDTFCTNLYECSDVNGLRENLNLFAEISNTRYFKRRDCQFIVILNKTDLFYRYLIYNSLSDYFPDYKGRNYEDYEDYDMQHIVQAVVRTMINGMNMNIKDIFVKENIELIAKYVGEMNIICYSWLDLCYKDGIKFIQNKFMEVNRNKDKKIIFRELCTLNYKQVIETMRFIQQEIIRSKIDFVNSTNFSEFYDW